MARTRNFKKGEVFVTKDNSMGVLVTGRSHTSYLFPGVVIMATENAEFALGTYSVTWDKIAFNESNIDISRVVELSLQQPIVESITH